MVKKKHFSLISSKNKKKEKNSILTVALRCRKDFVCQDLITNQIYKAYVHF